MVIQAAPVRAAVTATAVDLIVNLARRLDSRDDAREQTARHELAVAA